MRFLALIASCLLAGGSSTLPAQTRAPMTSSRRPIILPATPGNAVVLGTVLLGQPRTFTVFNIQAAGTITPDPDLYGASFQLQFLICDKADCTGDLNWSWAF